MLVCFPSTTIDDQIIDVYHCRVFSFVVFRVHCRQHRRVQPKVLFDRVFININKNIWTRHVQQATKSHRSV
jgi:hypothetical protein